MNQFQLFVEGNLIESGDKTSAYRLFNQTLFTNRRSNVNYNINPHELLEELKLSGHRQVCQLQFKRNDIVWMCRECQCMY